MRINVFTQLDKDSAELFKLIRSTIGQLQTAVSNLNQRISTLMATMQDLRDAVARNTSVDDSVLTLLQGISQQLKDAQAQNDPQAIADVIAQLDANTQKMSDAVAANTPAGPGGGSTPGEPSANP